MEGGRGLAAGISARLNKINGAASVYWASAMAALMGILLTLAALVRYTSWSNRRILGRWSEFHFVLILFFVLLFVSILVRVWKERAISVGVSAVPQLTRLFAALGLFSWGLSFFLSSVDDNLMGGLLLDFVFFGSTVPSAIFLEWISMIFLFVALVCLMENTRQRTQKKERARSRLVENSLVALTSLGIVLLLLEGGTRLLNVIRPITQGFPTKSSALWGRRFVHLNSLGYRDREPSIQRPGGARRILLIGDSFTFGAGIVDPKQRLGNRLEEALNRLPGEMRFEVMNAGKPDTDTLDHIETLKRMLVYQPDYVLLVYVFNDIEHVTKPTRSVVTDMRNPLDRVHPLRVLVLNSHLAEQIFVRLRKGFYQYVWNRDESGQRDPYENENLLRPHLETLHQLFLLARDAEIKARLIPFDTTIQLSAGSRSRYQRFVTAVNARGIPVWSLEAAFRGCNYSDLTVNSFDGHPNALANQLAANVIIERFRLEFLNGNKESGEEFAPANFQGNSELPLEDVEIRSLGGIHVM